MCVVLLSRSSGFSISGWTGSAEFREWFLSLGFAGLKSSCVLGFLGFGIYGFRVQGLD